MAHLDLYSCFSSSVHFAADALGIDPLTDPRGVTVTGGLPYAGGAASNYLTHAVATMVGQLRADPGAYGLVSGVGMHMTKHNAVVYSTEPPSSLPVPPPSAWPAPETVAIVDTWDGPGTVGAYSVVHGREGGPEWGLIVADVPDGRAYGRVEDPDLLAALESEEWVGRTVISTPDGQVNRVARFFDVVDRRPAVARRLLEELVGRLRQAADRQLEFGHGRRWSSGWLSAWSSWLDRSASSRPPATVQPGGVLIATGISQQDLADWCGTSRDSVVRALRHLRRSPAWWTAGGPGC